MSDDIILYHLMKIAFEPLVNHLSCYLSFNCSHIMKKDSFDVYEQELCVDRSMPLLLQ